MNWRPIETAPRDGQAILLLSAPYEMDTGPNGIHQVPAKVAIGHWFAEGTSWVNEGPHPDQDIYLAKTGVWFSGGGWFQPNEVTHWQPLPLAVNDPRIALALDLLAAIESRKYTVPGECGDACNEKVADVLDVVRIVFLAHGIELSKI